MGAARAGQGVGWRRMGESQVRTEGKREGEGERRGCMDCVLAPRTGD